MDKQKIILLKELIEQEERVNGIIRIKREEFEEDNQDLFVKQERIREAIRVSKALLSDDAIAEFQKTNEKKLLGGIGIRVGMDFVYDKDKAFDWAEEHKLCMTLDNKAFEKIAKTQFIDFVEKMEKITVTFPKEIKFEV